MHACNRVHGGIDVRIMYSYMYHNKGKIGSCVEMHRCQKARPFHVEKFVARVGKQARGRRQIRAYGTINKEGYEHCLREGQLALKKLESVLPALEEAKNVAVSAREPAAKAEREWQDAQNRLSDVHSKSHQRMNDIKSKMQKVLSIRDAGSSGLEVTQDMVLHHMNARMKGYLEQQPRRRGKIQISTLFQGIVEPLQWLSGAWVGQQVGLCCVEDKPYLVACVAVSMNPLDDSLRNLVLHWSITDRVDGGWMGSIPIGWHTYPGISQPHGPTAWQTNFGIYCPKLGDGDPPLEAITLHSIILEIPMEGHLQHQGGLKFVLKRADGGQPEWIKPSNHHDFYIDFTPAAQYITGESSSENEVEGNSDDDNTEKIGSFKMTDQAEEEEEKEEEEWTWAKSLAEAILRAAPMDYEIYKPTYSWLHGIQGWYDSTDNSGLSSEQSLARQIAQIRTLLSSARNVFKGQINKEKLKSSSKDAEAYEEIIESLLMQCDNLSSEMNEFDAASVKARQLQLERDRLWETHTSASNEASRLQKELKSLISIARRTVSVTHGRDCEITGNDLRSFCSYLAEQGMTQRGEGVGSKLWGKESTDKNNSSKSLFLVSNSKFRAAGVEASIAISVFMEGEESKVNKELKKHEQVATNDLEEQDGSNTIKVDEAEENHVFDSVVIAVAFGEDFPEMLSNLPIFFHFGLVGQRHGKWVDPPDGWTLSFPHVDNISSDKMLPMKACKLVHQNGKDLLVDPLVHGLCVKFPISVLNKKSSKGIEFVLKMGDNNWLQKEGGENFYAEFPLLN